MNTSVYEFKFTAQVVIDIHLLLNLYRHHLTLETPNNNSETLNYPDRHIMLRAIETVMYTRGLTTVIGRYCLAGKLSDSKLIVRLVPHVWFTHHAYIIDVFPVRGVMGVTLPVLFEGNNQVQTFIPSSETYPTGLSKEDRASCDAKVESLSTLFEKLLK
jgi:hypothetical protein